VRPELRFFHIKQEMGGMASTAAHAQTRTSDTDGESDGIKNQTGVVAMLLSVSGWEMRVKFHQVTRLGGTALQPVVGAEMLGVEIWAFRFGGKLLNHL
jgi:hypothetical protein